MEVFRIIVGSLALALIYAQTQVFQGQKLGLSTTTAIMVVVDRGILGQTDSFLFMQKIYSIDPKNTTDSLKQAYRVELVLPMDSGNQAQGVK